MTHHARFAHRVAKGFGIHTATIHANPAGSHPRRTRWVPGGDAVTPSALGMKSRSLDRLAP